MNATNELIQNLQKLHTTELGTGRIRKNLSLKTEHVEKEAVVEWCRAKIESSEASIVRRGKNWYVTVDGCIITINAYSYTIITAHVKK